MIKEISPSSYENRGTDICTHNRICDLKNKEDIEPRKLQLYLAKISGFGVHLIRPRCKTHEKGQPKAEFSSCRAFVRN